MSVDESHRRLYQRLEEVLGPEEAGTLIDDLSERAVSKADLQRELGILGSELRRELEVLEARFDAKLSDATKELTKTMYRTIVVTNATLAFTVAGLAFGAARLA